MLLFVYGSLKTGFPNHVVLKETDASKVCDGITVDKAFDLVSFGGFPGLIKRPIEGYAIHGEIWDVSFDTVLNTLDPLEGHPDFYRRDSIGYRPVCGCLQPLNIATAYFIFTNYEKLPIVNTFWNGSTVIKTW